MCGLCFEENNAIGCTSISSLISYHFMSYYRMRRWSHNSGKSPTNCPLAILHFRNTSSKFAGLSTSETAHSIKSAKRSGLKSREKRFGVIKIKKKKNWILNSTVPMTPRLVINSFQRRHSSMRINVIRSDVAFNSPNKKSGLHAPIPIVE